MRIDDISGNRYHRLVVLGKEENYKPRYLRWLCQCDCGNTLYVQASQLKSGRTKSCGCYQIEQLRKRSTTHGQSCKGKITPEYELWVSARKRAKKDELPFNITLEDIIIPEYCPVFPSIKLERNIGKGYSSLCSPTLDKVIPDLGYTKGNVYVISSKANKLKSNASLDELELLLKWVRDKVALLQKQMKEEPNNNETN